ncbi:ATP-dependent helicase [Tessaracoccus sp. OS52]|uniref:PD-(D/E)XK nuclease family protein n=1 Tax=Tessaracoccus sp. OS52 TaxID=2886691 RepID=UPI001D121948|nr:ATP-dependent helicase [Tessaracoccus sp. OS52]
MTSRPETGWRLVRQSPPPVPPLTPAQELAASPGPGIRVVVGGPGTGKTLALVSSVAARIETGGSLERMAVLASSRADAQRLRREIVRRTGGAQVSARVTTVHGLALGWLRELGDSDVPWRLLRAPEQELRIRELLDQLGPAFWPEDLREAVPTRAFARQVREVLARARQLSLDPSDVARIAGDGQDRLFERVAEFFEEYLTICDFDGSLDYAELVYRARLLLTDTAVAASLSSRIDAIIVDDVQSLDAAQLALLVDCARSGIALHAFGDPQQRIHGFRGATAQAVPTLLAEQNALRFDLTEGFRNSAAVASSLDSLRRRLSPLGAAPSPSPAPGPVGRVSVRVYDDEAAEQAHLAQLLRQAVLRDGLQWSDLAVVVRAGRSQLGPLARELSRYGVPVEVAGDEIALAGQLAVQVLLLALGVAARGGRPDADETNRLFTSPLSGLDSIGQRRLGRKLLESHPGAGNSVQLLGRCLVEPDLLEGVVGEEADLARRLALLLHDAADALAKGRSVREALWQVWDATNWPRSLRQAALAGSRRANHDLDAIVELFELAARREDLVGVAGARTFITEVSGQEIPADTGRELELVGRGVRLLTAHRAASDQWRRIWVVGVQEGRWPQLARRSLLLDPDRLAPDHLDAVSPATVLGDERRLFHVAIGRAAEELHVSASQGVEGEAGRPSRFLDELGVPAERVHGRPAQRLTAAALVAELRTVAGDPGVGAGLRRAAALRLAQFAAVTDADGHQPFSAADPRTWWGVREDSSGPPEAPRTVRISGSQLETLLSCPRRWFLSRRAGAEAGRRSRASVGDVVHLLAQRAVTDGLDAERLKEELARVWDRIPFEAEWLSVSERAEIEAAVERFSAWHDASVDDVVAVEVPFRVTLDVAGRSVELSGTVDRLQLSGGRLKVVDLKTGRSLLRQRDVADHAQLGVYQLAATLGAFEEFAPGVRQVAAPALLFLRHGEVWPELVEQPSIQDQAALEGEELQVGPTWVHDRLARAVTIIDSGEFPATQCSACNYCQFAASCPALHTSGKEIGA